jgi:hypothetical protein
MTPPSACTASVTVFQLSVCSAGVQTRRGDVALAIAPGWMASDTISPAEARLGVVLRHEVGGGAAVPSRLWTIGAMTARLVSLTLPGVTGSNKVGRRDVLLCGQ